MNAIPRPPRGNGYPTGDGKPMAETELHAELMTALMDALRYHYRHRDDVCASGNLLVFYEEGDRRRHVSPDVFVTFGVPTRERENYLVWGEGKAPDVVFEITSSSTRRDDTDTKLRLYRDVLKVREYFLFDPTGDWLDPPMQGFRLRAGQYVRIRPTPDGRLPSRALNLHLERRGRRCRLWDPVTERPLPTRAEAEAERADTADQRADAADQRAEAERRQAEAERQRADAADQRAERAEAEKRAAAAENERLRRELEEFRRQSGGGGP